MGLPFYLSPSEFRTYRFKLDTLQTYVLVCTYCLCADVEDMSCTYMCMVTHACLCVSKIQISGMLFPGTAIDLVVLVFDRRGPSSRIYLKSLL